MHEFGWTLGIHKRQALPVPREDAARKIVDRYRAARLKVPGTLLASVELRSPTEQ